MKKIEVLSSDDIRRQFSKEPRPIDIWDGFARGVYFGIAYANEQLGAKPSRQDEPWQPEPGMKCVFWIEGWKTVEAYTFSRFKDGYPLSKETIVFYSACAALESLDEIGKPPSYFIERGRWSGK